MKYSNKTLLILIWKELAAQIKNNFGGKNLSSTPLPGSSEFKYF